MELTNEFRVGVPVGEAWAVLTDVERIAPCLPGAQLLEVEGDEYRGTVKVKVGPITATYKGVAAFVDRDEAAGRAVLRAEGREARGQGNASALVTATLAPDGDGTVVKVVTDLTITGRVAQFGRGVLADVSAKLLDQFVACLEQTVLGPSPVAAALAGDVPSPPSGRAGSTSSRAAAKAVPPIPGMPSPDDEPIGGTEWAAPDAEPDRGGEPAVPEVAGVPGDEPQPATTESTTASSGPGGAQPAPAGGAASPGTGPSSSGAPSSGTGPSSSGAAASPGTGPSSSGAPSSGTGPSSSGGAPSSGTGPPSSAAGSSAPSGAPAPAATGTTPGGPGGAASSGAPDPTATGTTPGGPGGAASSGARSGNGDRSASGVRRIDSAPATPVDLIGAAGAPVARRVAPVAGALVVVLWLFRRRRRRRARA